MRHEEPRVAAARRNFPDVAAADECDRRSVGRDARLGERWQCFDRIAGRLRQGSPEGLRYWNTTHRNERDDTDREQ